MPPTTPHFVRATADDLDGYNRPLVYSTGRHERGERATPRVFAVIGAALLLLLTMIFTSCDGVWFGINSGGPSVSGSIGAYFPIDNWGGGYGVPIGPPPPPPGGFGGFRPHYGARPFIP